MDNATQPTSFEDITTGTEVKGTVKQIELFGAFVDIGLGRDALLHISQLSSRPVRNVTDVVNQGDEIAAWVLNVDQDKQLVTLTLNRPPDVGWSEVRAGGVYTGKVTRIEKYGAFVDIGAERPGRIHISELSQDYVKNTEDVVSVGDEVQVKVLNVNPSKRQIDLSIKALTAAASTVVETYDDGDSSDENQHVPTAMEMAFRRAMEGTELEEEFEVERRRSRNKKKRGSSRRGREQQEEIISRTLQHRRK
ncbi:MAG: S1 RNA-binding domain-containing protein [Anaerolineae bacterium]|nr:S1 RNA-binding domain-containing protein [Anaerolineae bacterium]